MFYVFVYVEDGWLWMSVLLFYVNSMLLWLFCVVICLEGKGWMWCIFDLSDG